MSNTSDDWRLRGQDEYLQGAAFVRKRYRIWSETWEHDHCDFCWAKFMDPQFSDDHRKYVAEHDDVLTEGYAALGTGPENEDDYHWVCPTCFDDFRASFGWTVVDGKPSAA